MPTRGAAVQFINRGEAEAVASCTLIQGVGNVDFGPAITKSYTLAPGQSRDAVDNGGADFTLPSLSCNLRPGVEIAMTSFDFLEDIGN